MSSSLPTQPAVLPSSETIDKEKRSALILAGVVGGAGVVAAALPFASSFQPSARARAAGAPVEFDLSTIAPGQMKTVEWRGKPVWVLRRTPDMLDSIKKASPDVADPKSERTAYPTPEYARNEYRSIKPEFLVAVGICTHLGCSPTGPYAAGSNLQLADNSGFVCPCHGSTFDLAGRVYRNKPAPDNLEIPPYKYLTDGQILIGDDA
jgi:ubiquinol-cytochrome c reductase iron-sulfur subunit